MEEGIAVCDAPSCIVLHHGHAAMRRVLHLVLPTLYIAHCAVCLLCEGAGEVSEGAGEVGGCGVCTGMREGVDESCAQNQKSEKKKELTTHHGRLRWHVTSHPHGIVEIACGACTQNMISKQQERVTYLVTESHVEEGRGSRSGQE